MKEKSRNCSRPGYWLNQHWIEYPTYSELKKHLLSAIRESDNEEITVFRQRRGEWGEWYEVWRIQSRKPVIYKQGWN